MLELCREQERVLESISCFIRISGFRFFIRFYEFKFRFRRDQIQKIFFREGVEKMGVQRQRQGSRGCLRRVFFSVVRGLGFRFLLWGGVGSVCVCLYSSRLRVWLVCYSCGREVKVQGRDLFRVGQVEFRGEGDEEI